MWPVTASFALVMGSLTGIVARQIQVPQQPSSRHDPSRFDLRTALLIGIVAGHSLTDA